MAARVATGLLVAALVRRIEGEGGSVMVLARGDATAGTILLAIADRGRDGPLLERMAGPDGAVWRETGPDDAGLRGDYLRRRRAVDPDLWIVEVDHRDARRIATDLLA